MKKIILVIAAVALLASPAMAVDWNFYGSARMATFYISRDFGDDQGDLSGEGTAFNGDQDEDDRLQWEMQTNSRLGATVRAENIRGRFEWGIDDRENNVSARRLFGEWDFGAARLKVGKDYTPIAQFVSGQVFDGDLGLLGLGAAYGSRRGQIALSFGGFEVALIDPQTAGIIRGMTTGDVDNNIPKIEAKFGMSFDTWNFAVNGGYQYFEIEDAGLADEDVDVHSWTLGGDIGFNFGPAYLRAAFNAGTNVGDAGWHLTKSDNTAAYDGDDDTDDVDTIMGLLVGGFKFTDQLTFEAGVGYREDDSDAPGEDEDEDLTGYLQAVISLAPGVWIIPEVGFTDLDDDISDDDDNDEGDQFYLGAKWQIDF